jgi:hypothetical protein
MVATFTKDAGRQSDRAPVIWVEVIRLQIARTPDKGKAMIRGLTATETVSKHGLPIAFP